MFHMDLMDKSEKGNGVSAIGGADLVLVLEPRLMPRFFRIFQKGAGLKAEVGCTVRSFLCEQMGISTRYVDESIQTLFLDGQPVDRMEAAVIRDGSVLALSAAMPGFAGATLRKGGYYSTMRSSITYKGEGESVPRRSGVVNLKLFNLLAGELGPGLLERGVWVKGMEIATFLEGQTEDFWSGCREIRLNGKGISRRNVSRINWPVELLLQVYSFSA